MSTMRPAPRRQDASTASRPTAPSPTTTTSDPFCTCAHTAAWWPVPNTSESVSRLGISAESSATGSFISELSANGTRAASPWPPSVSAPQALPFGQALVRPAWQYSQVPSA